jgi:hypothetical protein
MGVNSFVYERALVKTMSTKNLPIFITETGWSADAISDLSRADYYQQAFNNTWSDNGLVAVTPFLLRANGAFQEFSFFTEDGTSTLQYKMIKSLHKVRGMPVLVQKPPVLLKQQKKVLGLSPDEKNINFAEASTYRNFTNSSQQPKKFSLTNLLTATFRWLIGG